MGSDDVDDALDDGRHDGRNDGSMSGCMGVCTFGPLLLAAVLIALGVVLLRKSS